MIEQTRDALSNGHPPEVKCKRFYRLRAGLLGFGWGLLGAAIGSMIGLVAYLAVYVWSQSPVYAQRMFSPGSDSWIPWLGATASAVISGYFGCRRVSKPLLLLCCVAAVLLITFLVPATAKGNRFRHAELLQNPLADLDHSAVIFFLGCPLGVATSYFLSTPARIQKT